MNEQNSGSLNESLKRLIARYLEKEQAGELVNREELLKRHPQLAKELQSFFAHHDRMKRAKAPAAEIDAPTMPRSPSGAEDPTIAPTAPSGNNEATIPPQTDAASTENRCGQKVRCFGDYELSEEIARGGMGVVYKARQGKLNRLVALKMILAGQLAGENDVRRFHVEAEAAANLDHPGIVPIYEIGEHDGQHYFSMAFVEGESLAAKVADGPLPPEEAAELTRKIAEAMAHAHERGVIHRDLKPANVLLDKNGEPKVTDFGLAKKLEADSNLTGTGQILGTPSYMSPEQAGAKWNKVGTQSDVYSLGGILYCLLTGRPPFQSANPADILLHVLEKEPVSLQVLNPGIPKDLETICLKCLEKDPVRRYQSAGKLGQDLDRYLTGKAVLARPPSLPYRIRKYVARRKLLVGAATTISVLLLAGTIILFKLMQAQLELTQAELREARTTANLHKLGAIDLTNKSLLHVRTLPITFSPEEFGWRIFVPAGKRYKLVTHVGNLPGLTRLPTEKEGLQLSVELRSGSVDREVIALAWFPLNQDGKWTANVQVIEPPTGNPPFPTVTTTEPIPPAYSRFFTLKQTAKIYARLFPPEKTHVLKDGIPHLELSRGQPIRTSSQSSGFTIWIEKVGKKGRPVSGA